MTTALAEQHLEAALQAFLTTTAENVLGIGPIENVTRLRRFERPYSVQAVYRITGQNGTRDVYVKWFKNWRNKPEDQFKREIAVEYQTIQFWYEQLAEFEGITTFRPLFYSEEHDCVITEATEGENLAEVVQRLARGWVPASTRTQLGNYFHRSGQLLRHFQEKTKRDSFYDYQHLVEDVDIRLKQLVDIPHSGFSANDRERVLAFYRRHIQVGTLPRFPEVVLHRDFGMGNILVNDHQVVIHDFNRMEYGHPYFDFTRLYHQLIMLGYKPIYLPGTIRYLQTAYCQGYGVTCGPNDVVFRFFLLRHFFTHLLGLVKTTETSWVSRLYSRWVKSRHLAHIRRLIRN